MISLCWILLPVWELAYECLGASPLGASQSLWGQQSKEWSIDPLHLWIIKIVVFHAAKNKIMTLNSPENNSWKDYDILIFFIYCDRFFVTLPLFTTLTFLNLHLWLLPDKLMVWYTLKHLDQARRWREWTEVSHCKLKPWEKDTSVFGHKSSS